MTMAMFYICEIAALPLHVVAGPFDTEAEAAAASGALEADCERYRMKTFVWQCEENAPSNPVLAKVAAPVLSSFPVAVGYA
jgi:hypothetical protein